MVNDECSEINVLVDWLVVRAVVEIDDAPSVVFVVDVVAVD